MDWFTQVQANRILDYRRRVADIRIIRNKYLVMKLRQKARTLEHALIAKADNLIRENKR